MRIGGKSWKAAAIWAASAVSRRCRMGIFRGAALPALPSGAVPEPDGVPEPTVAAAAATTATAACCSAGCGTVTGAPQLLHLALRPAKESGTVNERPQPSQVKPIMSMHLERADDQAD